MVNQDYAIMAIRIMGESARGLESQRADPTVYLHLARIDAEWLPP